MFDLHDAWTGAVLDIGYEELEDVLRALRRSGSILERGVRSVASNVEQ